MTNNEIISDEKYEKNMKTINKLTRLINECKSYLGSKKMELVKCEDDSAINKFNKNN